MSTIASRMESAADLLEYFSPGAKSITDQLRRDALVVRSLEKTMSPDDNIPRMDIKEFRDGGYLHEINRYILHPHGLAMEVIVGDDGTEKLGGVWDYRDDPEGMNMGPKSISPLKAARYAKVSAERRKARIDSLGYWVQPIPTNELTTGSESVTVPDGAVPESG